MAIVINGSGTVTGLSVGGLPDGTVDSDTLASGIAASKLTGALPAISGASLTGISDESGLASQQVFTSSGTWTKPTGITTVKVIVTGGGGGGGSEGNSHGDESGPGGAGATAIEVIDVSSVSSVTVTVGAAGAGSSGQPSSGGTGGTSSFGSYCSATGGEGGVQGDSGDTSGGSGGTATGGDINLNGGDGSNGFTNGTDFTYDANRAIGGSSYWGGGGRGSTNKNKAPRTGRAYGSGGGGTTPRYGTNGMAGAAGIVVVEEYK